MATIGRILVFNYAPRLKVAGTFHILIEKDKRTLERLIDESDFVALEGAQSIKLRHHTTRRGYNVEENAFYTGLFDYSYLGTFFKLNKRKIRKLNELGGRLVGAEIEEGKEFEQESEFEFCYRVAKEKGKLLRTYMVDMPIHEIFQKLIGLPREVRLRHLWNLYLLFGETPEEVVEIMYKQREAYMLQVIVEKEGSLLDLTRNGLLVTGYRHAMNYQKSALV